MRRRILSKAERLDWLRLARSEGVGPVTFFELLRRFGEAGAVLEALPRLAAQSGRIGNICSKKAAQDEMRAIEDIGAQLLCAVDPEFPIGLRALNPPPPVLTVQGDLSLLGRPLCAIVGARNASAASLRIAFEIAQGLGQAGYGVVSGLARGIDAAAHKGSLATGTIGVVAGGIDHVYPPEHAALQAAIAAQGLLVAEQKIGSIATARDFPRRNRLVTGLCLGVVVVEAAMKSGSLISASTAGDQGREVMAVPNSPLEPRATGTNYLLKNGASLVENADDVLTILRGSTPPQQLAQSSDDEFTPAPAGDWSPGDLHLRARLAELLSPTPVRVDDLMSWMEISPRELAILLVEMELAGELLTLPGGYVCANLDPQTG